MPPNASILNQRSVDSLEKIYAVIVALAVSLAITNLLLDREADSFVISLSILNHLPSFLAFVITIVPFYHGMNRHLDNCYLDIDPNKLVKGALLFDFVVFFIESSILFAVAASIKTGLQCFFLIGILLGTDIIWAFISHLIHYSKLNYSVIRWAVINLAACSIALFCYFNEYIDRGALVLLYCLLAFLRTVADYYFCWKFYFPSTED